MLSSVPGTPLGGRLVYTTIGLAGEVVSKLRVRCRYLVGTYCCTTPSGGNSDCEDAASIDRNVYMVRQILTAGHITAPLNEELVANAQPA